VLSRIFNHLGLGAICFAVLMAGDYSSELGEVQS
jgi:hypothetical protein